LLGDISGRLAGERGHRGAVAVAISSVTGGAGQQVAIGIAGDIDRRNAVRLRGSGRRRRQAGIISRDLEPVGGRQAVRDPRHRPVVAAAVGVGFELAHEIARIQPGKPRRASSVAASVESVTGEARVVGARLGTAHRDDPAVVVETVGHARRRRAPAKYKGESARRAACCRQSHAWPEPQRPASVPDMNRKTLQRAGNGLNKALAVVPVLAAACGCQKPPDQQHFVPQASAENGKAVIERAGCGACHTIPGVSWPQGKVAPSLSGFGRQTLIAGKVANRPDTLADFVRNAPAVVPGVAMPPMPLTPRESRDVAAYLYTLRS
jgi:cytochrome c551/c552